MEKQSRKVATQAKRMNIQEVSEILLKKLSEMEYFFRTYEKVKNAKVEVDTSNLKPLWERLGESERLFKDLHHLVEDSKRREIDRANTILEEAKKERQKINSNILILAWGLLISLLLSVSMLLYFSIAMPKAMNKVGRNIDDLKKEVIYRNNHL